MDAWTVTDVSEVITRLQQLETLLRALQELGLWIVFCFGIVFGWSFAALLWRVWLSLDFGGGLVPRVRLR